jgi:P-type Ca2+ transporter type 2C
MVNMNLVKPIHTKIPGRARYQVDGLRQSEGAKAFIERQLAGSRDIVSVSASTVTSTVLITFNSGNTAQSIERRLESVVAAWRRDPGPRPDNKPLQTPALPACGTDGQKRAPAPAADAPWTASPPAVFQESGNWHRMHRQEVLELVASDPQRGLGLVDARARLEQYGLNTLPEGAPRSPWEILVGQINSLPTYLLAAAAGVALLTGGVIDALVILGVVAANAAIGFVTEKEADKTIQSLKKLVHPKAEVIRDGEPLTVAVEEIVVGDLLELKPGAYVAADCRIIRAVNLSIDESMLTGESMPVYKQSAPLGGRHPPGRSHQHGLHGHPGDRRIGDRGGGGHRPGH